MSRRIETEKKYYCFDSNSLLEKVKDLGFKEEKIKEETDEYFTDINSEYIKNRTCLRIRIINNDKMEVTFKGKSIALSNTYSKLESNFDLDINNYDSIVNLFSAIGYYSYSIVKKHRSTFFINDYDYKYSIMIDSIESLGGFVEFEILCNNDETYEDELKIKLDGFINMFSSLNLEEAKLPYRDFVAIKKYEELLPKKDINGIHVNLDYFFKVIEKDFFKYYKKICSETSKDIMKWGIYKGNNLNDEVINPELNNKINNYFEKLIIKDSNVLLFFKLIKEVKKNNLEIILSTRCNKIFIDSLLTNLKSLADFKDIIYLNTSKSIFTELKSYEIDLENYFNIISKNLKETNSNILIIINNYNK